jgi:hypothetical protein
MDGWTLFNTDVAGDACIAGRLGEDRDLCTLDENPPLKLEITHVHEPR